MKLNTLPLELEYKNKKLFLNNKEVLPSTRKLKDMKNVLLDPLIINDKNENENLYLMFRDLKREEDKEIFEKYKVRYDVTVIFSKYLGIEFNKTFGHIHPIAENNLSYPEIYEVLSGKAIFILQKFENNKVEEVLLVFGKKNDKILIPPNYGHVTVNICKKDLILSNIVSTQFSSIYEIYEKKRGAAIYIIKEQKIYPSLKNLEVLVSSIKIPFGIIKNQNYSENFEIKYVKSKDLINFSLKENLYKSFIENPKKFNFLNKPSLLFKK